MKDIRPGMDLRSTFLASDCAVRNDSRGVPYLSLRLLDRTGAVDARMWRLPAEFSGGLEHPEYVYVEGHTHEHRGMLQVKIEKMKLVAPEEVEEDDYLPAIQQDRSALKAELELNGRELENAHLRALFSLMVADEEFWEAFCTAPAAKAMHHARIGGLLEHSVYCMRTAKVLADIYPVDRDLLSFGAAFHDVGKVEELSWHGSFSYTTEGRLLGHVLLGDRIINSYIQQVPGFPEDLAMHLSHIMLSHQGETQYGSPKRPKTLEALLVHFIDNLDARVEMFMQATQHVSPDGWSHHDNPLERALYIPAKEDKGART